MGKDSVSVSHGVTALVYSPASISDPEGLAVTCWHHFIHLVENERRVPLQFYDLIPLGKISVAPGMSNAQGMENRKYALVLSLSPSLYVLQLQTPTHKNICLHTKIFVRGCL